MNDKALADSEEQQKYAGTLHSLPHSWCWTTVEDISIVVRGGSPRPAGDPRYFGGPVPWITVGSLTADEQPYLRNTTEGLTEAGKERSRWIDPDTLLLTNSGATLGVPKITMIGGCINDGSVALLHVDHPLKLYLYYFLKSKTKHLRSINQGAAQPNLNTGIVKAIAVPLPPMNEQKRIATKIEELFSDLDAGVTALKRAKANLKRYRAAVLKAAVEGKLTEEWRAKHPAKEPASALLARILKERRQKWEADQLAKFAAAGKQPPKNWREKYVEPQSPDTSGLPNLPDGWSWVTAEQLCSQITDGEHIQPPYQEEGFPMLTATHVRNGHVEFKNVRYISESDFRRCLHRCAPTQGDVLIVSVGATTGRAGIVQQCDPFALVRSVLLLKAIKPASFLLHWIQSPWCQTWIGRASGATAQAHFYISDAKRMPVPLPPENEQSVIVDEVDRCLSLISVAETQIEHGLLRAFRLRQSILKQAFEGKLVPQDPTDESASTLLARLAENRTQADTSTPKPKTARRKAKS